VAPIVYVFGLIGEGIGMSLGVLKGVVIAALGVVRATFSTVFGTIFNVVSDVFRRMVDTARSAFQGVVNFVIRGVNLAIGALNGLVRAANLIPGVSISYISPIRPVALAEGGIVTGPTFALIGEAGPEAVVPLSGPYMPDFLQGDGGGGTTIVVNVQAGLVSSPDQVGQQIIEAIRRAERRSGQVFAAA
jgi:hypothetical protein